jgi:TP901 family phage tail tape measure protein
MPRYGSGHEDFDKEAAELAKLRAAREAQVSREAKYQAELQKTTGIEDANTRTSVTRKRAKAETADVEERAAKSTGKATEATKLDTAAIEANTRARTKANRETAFGESALRGGRAPQFAEAYRLQQERGAPIGTNEIRRLGEQYGQSGYRRAVDVRQALAAGLAPPAQGAQYGASTRIQAAHEEVVAADLEYARSRDAYNKAIKKGSAAEAELEYGAREAAKTRRESAASGLAAAEKAEADLVTTNAAKIEREIAARQRIIEQHTAEARIERLALPAPGQTVQGMPVHPAQTRTAIPFTQYAPDWIPGSAEAGAAQAAAGAQQAAAAHHANALSMAQEAEAQGRLADAAHIYNTELDNPARAAALESNARAQFYSENAAAAEQRMAKALRDTNVAFYPLDQSMHRHGALTSEFIAAAARGEVTLREMGNQAVITAGKFGGWTVAATAVYGVVGALGQVGKGAMDASSGVDQAYRVITSGQNSDKLQGSFANLSRQFNVPIETASDAVYRMGQVFHNQADAVKAAEASLYSYKTGEVDVATSTRNLIAIQRAFGLSSNQLVDIFDQINQAQNTFGISIGDTEAGLAKAGGTWRNAGGDLSYLLGLFVAIQKATGRSGEEIGTGLSRLYFVQHPENAKKLQDLGVDVDPTQAQKTFQSAFKVAREHPDRIQGIASGLLGNQYARLLTATLRDQDTLNKALQDTSPEKSKGSAQKELAKVLGQVDEQVQALMNGLQRIGEELAKAGTFNFFALALKGANDLLTVVEKLLAVFNMIPKPIREGVVMLGEMYLAVALLRRLGATERFANTPLGPLADPIGRARTQTIAGLRTFQTEASNNAERVGSRASDIAFKADADRRYANALHADAKTLEHLDAQDEARLAAEAEANVAEKRARRSETDLVAANEHLTVAREQAAVAERELAAATATNRRTFNTVAAERGWVMPRQLDQPNTLGVAPSAVGGAAAAEATAVERRAAAVAGGISAAAAGAGAARYGGQTGAAAAAVATRASAGLTVAGRGYTKLKTGVQTLGASAAGFAAALGPLDIALIALAGLGYAYSKIEESAKRSEEARKAIQQQATTLDALATQQGDINKILGGHHPAKGSAEAKALPPGAQTTSIKSEIEDWNNRRKGTTAAATTSRFSACPVLTCPKNSRGRPPPSTCTDSPRTTWTT